jgi:DNA-binding GntR family transcriptional regulator
MLTVLHDALSLLGSTTLRSKERAAETLQEHRAVVDAVKGRDADAAELALRIHIRAAQKVRMQQLFNER